MTRFEHTWRATFEVPEPCDYSPGHLCRSECPYSRPLWCFCRQHLPRQDGPVYCRGIGKGLSEGSSAVFTLAMDIYWCLCLHVVLARCYPDNLGAVRDGICLWRSSTCAWRYAYGGWHAIFAMVIEKKICIQAFQNRQLEGICIHICNCCPVRCVSCWGFLSDRKTTLVPLSADHRSGGLDTCKKWNLVD